MISSDRPGRFAAAVALASAMVLSACSDSGSTDGDSGEHYLLTTEFLGPQQALSAARAADGSPELGFGAYVANDRGAEWVLTALDGGSYRITNRAVGTTESLDVVNDGVFDRVTLAASGDFSGQQWLIGPLDNGYCRLTSAFLGEQIALDVSSDTDTPMPTLRSVDNVSGQHWRVARLGTGGGPLDQRCTGVAGDRSAGLPARSR